MMQKTVVLAVVLVLAVAGVTAIVVAGRSNTAPDAKVSRSEKPGARETEPQQTGKGMAAVERVAGAEKYLFAFFRKEENDRAAAMRKVVEAAVGRVADRADWIEVDVTDASEKPIVEKSDLDRAPMPLVLALAPNGAIMGGFPTEVGEQELLEAFGSPCTEACMKWLQKNKLVFLCVQNAGTGSNEAAVQGVHDFKADTRFTQATEIVRLDPADAEEADFLEQLQIDPGTQEAVTVFLAPPGVPIAKYEGATDKDVLVAALEKASSVCGPGGCGPSGCCPK